MGRFPPAPSLKTFYFSKKKPRQETPQVSCTSLEIKRILARQHKEEYPRLGCFVIPKTPLHTLQSRKWLRRVGMHGIAEVYKVLNATQGYTRQGTCKLSPEEGGPLFKVPNCERH